MKKKTNNHHPRTDPDKWGKKGFEQGQGQGSSESGYEGRQENQQNRGFEEDQPENPVRSGKTTPNEQKGRDYTPDTYDE